MVVEAERFISTELKSRVSLWKNEPTRAEDGLSESNWVKKFSTWAGILTIGGEEGRLAASTSSLVKYRINMRRHNEKRMTPDMRLQWGDKMLEIRSIRVPVGHEPYIEVNAEHKQGAI